MMKSMVIHGSLSSIRTTICHPVKESTRGGIHLCVWLPVNTCGSEAGHILYIYILIISIDEQKSIVINGKCRSIKYNNINQIISNYYDWRKVMPNNLL